MIAKGESLEDTATRLCQEVENLVPGVACSVATVDPSGRLRSLAAPSLPESYKRGIEGVAIGPQVGTCGTAAYLGEDITAMDIETDPRWEGFRHLVRPMGFKACWSRPILNASKATIATFAFYYKERRGPSQLERNIVDECLNLCAIALDRHRRVLEHQRRATIDDLTGLPNRAAFDAALTQLDCRVPGAWALVALDLDNLKVVNDTFGHQAGDILLRQVSERLRDAARPDVVYRIGGDEFAVIVRHPDRLARLDETAAAYLAALAPPADCGGHVIRPRATIGIAVLSAEDHSPERVRQNADFALYHAKETSRSGSVLYSPGIGTRMTRRLTAIRAVDAALREGRIVAHYQPVVRLATGEIVGLEALCRMWMDNELVPAANFHEATTDAHVASTLTAHMLRQVAADLRKWLDMGIPFQHVGINVASADFHSGIIYPEVVDAFESQDVPLQHIILEVTELVYMSDDAGVVQKATAALREKGLRVALDDFGTGYASLTHLISVPVDYIKLDKTFVERITWHQPSQVIVEGMLNIAAKLGIKVVAEGIETAEQAAQLIALGCTMGQGYFYSRAVDSDRAGEMMRTMAEGIPDAAPPAHWRLG